MNKVNCSVMKDNLLRFIDLLRLKGELESRSILLNIKDGEIQAPFILSDSKVLAIRGSFKDDDITNLGEICIDDTRLLRDFVNSFSSEEIFLNKKNNKLVLTATKESLKISAILRDPQYIKESLPKNKGFEDTLKMVSDNTFHFSKEQVNEIVKHTSIINPKSIILEGKDKKLSLKLGANENDLTTSFDLPTTIKPFKIKLSIFLVDLLSIINADIIMSAQENSALYIKVKDEFSKVEYVLASLKTE